MIMIHRRFLSRPSIVDTVAAFAKHRPSARPTPRFNSSNASTGRPCRPIQVAIDGPAASGKSSTAQLVAARLGFSYIDSGALFRCITLKALTAQPYPPQDWSAFVRSTHLSISPLDLATNHGSTPIIRSPPKLFLDHKDVTRDIRSPQVTRHVSEIAAIPAVRSALLDLKRQLASEANVVMDGRDIGTSVFPDARVKVYLDASPEIRARRRLGELMSRGSQGSKSQWRLDEMVEELRVRDLADMQRKESPLRCAEDAVRLDTSGMTQAEVVDAIVSLVEERAPEVVRRG